MRWDESFTEGFGDLHKFVPFVKMVENENGRHMVYGIATAEEVDKDREICDYTDTAPQYKAWSDEIHKATTGSGQEPSLGNIRIQHSLEMGGKVTKLDFQPDKQQVWIGSEPKNEEIWDQVRRGFYTGYSQGGKYLYRKCNVCKTSIPEGHYCPKCRKDTVIRYAAKISEVSYVDNPCLDQAHFAFVKGLLADKQFAYVDANGSTTLRKFQLSGKGPDPGQQIDQQAHPAPEPEMPPNNNGQVDPPSREIPKCATCKVDMIYKCPTCGCGMDFATHPPNKLFQVLDGAVEKLTPRHPSGRFTNRASGEAHDKLTEAGFEHVATGSESPYSSTGATESAHETKQYKHNKSGRTITLHNDGRWDSDNGHGVVVNGRGLDTLVAHINPPAKKALLVVLDDAATALGKGGPGSGPRPGDSHPHSGYSKLHNEAEAATDRTNEVFGRHRAAGTLGTSAAQQELADAHSSALVAHYDARNAATPGSKEWRSHDDMNAHHNAMFDRAVQMRDKYRHLENNPPAKAESDELNKGVKYLVTEPDGTTHLPYTDADGKPNHNLMGAAWAALHGGYRGNKYGGPDKDKAIAHLTSIYHSEGMDLPGKAQGGTMSKLTDTLEQIVDPLLKGGPGSGPRPGEPHPHAGYARAATRASDASKQADDDTKIAERSGSKIDHQEAASSHGEAGDRHMDAAKQGNAAQRRFHTQEADKHYDKEEEHLAAAFTKKAALIDILQDAETRLTKAS